MSNLLGSIFVENGMNVPTYPKFLLCLGCAVLLGFLISIVNKLSTNSSRGFSVSLLVIPAAVSCIIFVVNGNLEMSVAVLGTFSLVRFRSAQGSASEITSLLVATAAGVAAGVGYLGIAVTITVIMCAVILLAYYLGYSKRAVSQDLRILVPESMNYSGMFDDLFKRYTYRAELVKTKTTAMGSMYELTYNVSIKDKNEEKEFLDAIRVRNGNLTVLLTVRMKHSDEL